MDNPTSTPLTEHHKGLGAKIVPFAGFAMPLQYTSILAEHAHTRTQAAVFDICHMGEFTLQGPGAAQALNRCVSQDVETLDVCKCRYGFLVNDAGGVIDDLIVYRLEAERFMIVVNASRSPRISPDSRPCCLRAPFGGHLGPDRQDRPTGPEILRGPLGASARQWSDLKYFNFTWTTFEGLPAHVSRTGYTGELATSSSCRPTRPWPVGHAPLDPASCPPGSGPGHPAPGNGLTPLRPGPGREPQPERGRYGGLLKSGEFMGCAGARRSGTPGGPVHFRDGAAPAMTTRFCAGPNRSGG